MSSENINREGMKEFLKRLAIASTKNKNNKTDKELLKEIDDNAKDLKLSNISRIVGGIEEKKEQLQGSVKGIADNVANQTQELTNRGQEVSTHVSNVLGSYVKPAEDGQDANQSGEDSSQSNKSNEDASSNEEDKPIYEETLDYGRYLYCQQVIKDYENQHP